MPVTIALSSLLPKRFRQSWVSTQRRIAALERQQADLSELFDLLLADASHSEACELGLHSQNGRRAVVTQMFQQCGLRQAIETGTYIGRTTNYLARTFGVPVHSCELVAKYHHTARRMLRNTPGVHLYLKDSRSFLRELAASREMTEVPSFIYLDAHWYDDLPLADEIDIIAAAWKDYVVLVDDFAVPGDPGYAYDDYGPGKALVIEYLLPLLKKHRLRAYFPTTRAADETGGRAGYVVVAPERHAVTLGTIPLLKEYSLEKVVA
jgi:predicted O-methyltransferase YrrM